MLGHFVADLNYKRVYVTSVEALVQAPVWEKARTLRPVRSGEIYEAKKLEADKIEIQKIEAGEIRAKWETDKKVSKEMYFIPYTRSPAAVESIVSRSARVCIRSPMLLVCLLAGLLAARNCRRLFV